VARVLPDRPGINKTFDYSVPQELADRARLGAIVRVDLHGRRVGGWIVDDDAEPATKIALKPIAKVSSFGPTAEILELAEWAAWRWAGARAHFLRTASPERNVTAIVPDWVEPRSGGPGPVEIRRLPPAASPFDLIADHATDGALVLVPSLVTARRLVAKLRRDGVVDAALYPDDWARVRNGAFTVGTRSAAWAPMRRLRSVILIDEHDEVWQQESAPTWHARDVVIERARRQDASCTLISPAPTLEGLQLGELVTRPRDEERAGWPVVQVVDRREEPPGAGLLSDEVARLVRTDARVVCVLNRKGRSKLLACAACGALERCEECDAAVMQDEQGFACGRCGTRRPLVCLECGAARFRNLRAGVSRVSEELAALARKPVVEVTGDTRDDELDRAAIFVGTEAVLHRVARADVVVFLDFDQELLAPRYRAAEEALTLLIRGARLVGGRHDGGRVLVQTRMPQHEAIQAALHGDPDRLVVRERARRGLLRFPPYAAVAVVSGAAASTFMHSFGRPLDVEVLGPTDGQWLLRSDTHPALLDALAATTRPSGRLRIAIDPLRI
jgi:primosomal protein N' (replication factor Y)